jgi:hypothetical protein
MSKRWLCIVIALMLLGSALLCWYVWWQHRVADSDFRRLLRGDTDIDLVSLEFEGEGIVLRDGASLGYLSETFRTAQVVGGEGVSDVPYDGSSFGGSYFLRVDLSSGSSVRCVIRVSRRKEAITILFPLDDFSDGITYLMALRTPIPMEISAALSNRE